MANSVMRRLEQAIARREGAKNITLPSYAQSVLDISKSIANIPNAQRRVAQVRQEQYSADLLTQQRFEQRLQTPILNAFSDSTIYNNKTLDEIEAKWDRMHSEDIKRFPDLSIDLTDTYESKREQLNKYRELNNHYSYLSSKIPDTKQFLLDVTNDLSNTSWEDLTTQKKIDLKNRLMEGTQNIATLGRMVENNKKYFANYPAFNRDADDIQIGIIGSYKQLLSQIDTFDPDGNVISKEDLSAINNSVVNNRPEEIIKINEMNVGIKSDRLKGKSKNFDTSHADWIKLDRVHKSPEYQKAWTQKMDEFKNLDATEKQKALEDPEYWIDYMVDPSKPGGINLYTLGADLQSLESKMDIIDADFEKDTGNKYSEWMGRATPWRKTQEELDLEREKRLEGDVTRLVGGIPVADTSGVEGAKEQEKFEQFKSTLPPLGAGRLTVAEGATAKRYPSTEDIGETIERNNPGNLRFMNQTDAIGKDEQGFATFDTPEDGWQALYNQINKDKTRDFTLEEFTNKYAPPSENDTTAYIKSLQQQLKVNKSTKITDIDTKKLAVAIAKQEGYGGKFPEKEKVKKIKDTGTQLTTVHEGKETINYEVANYNSFKKEQRNLQKVASQKYNTKENKTKYKNVRDFIKAKFDEWLRKTGKLVVDYKPGDFKYFIPTKVDQFNKINQNPDMNIYNLYHPEAWLGAEAGKATRALIRPKLKGGDYFRFAKDFDGFRKFLQGA